MKKLLKVVLCIAIILSNFSPLFVSTAKAAGNSYEVLVGYPSDDSNNLSKYDVSLGTYGTYVEALNRMNSYSSNELAVAYIKKNGTVVNAAYGIAQQDVINGTEIAWNSTSDVYKNVYTSARAARQQDGDYTSEWLTYMTGAWANDSVLLDFDDTYDAVKVKISGAIGYVRLEDVIVKPISRYYGSTQNYVSNFTSLKINTDSCLNVRTEAKIGDNEADKQVCKGESYRFYANKTVSDGTYDWYYINYGVESGYIATKSSENWVTFNNELKFDTFYYSYNNELYHQIHMGQNKAESNIKIGTAPYYYGATQNKSYYFNNVASSSYTNSDGALGVSSQNRYYSFDGHYFYRTLFDMVKDYKSGNYNTSLNKDYPYFAYFQFSPSRVISNYSADQFNLLTSTYVGSGPSKMLGIGTQFVQASTAYGVSSLILYGAAGQESNYGRSAIALDKNNLYGTGAIDGNAYASAYPYGSTQESINAYAFGISSGSYATNTTKVYGGTHFGDKNSGQMRVYASDPYSGESKASVAYTADQNSGGATGTGGVGNSGGIDNYSNTLGVTIKTTPINIYLDPNSTSRVIYNTVDYRSRTLSNMPFVVTDKVLGSDSKYYYKVYTDVTLTKDRYVSYSNDDIYNYSYCYGYIREEDLYVQNKQPVLTAESKTIKQFTSFNPLDGVSAIDYEDGMINNKISYSGSVDADKPGTYELTYSVSDSSKFTTSKKITVNVEVTDKPIITADDIIIPQYKSFSNLTGVTVTDKNDGNITNNVQIDGSVDVNIVGEYNLTYTSTNSAGLTTVKNRKVTVVTNEYPVINASNVTTYLNRTFNYLGNVTANDKEDGNLTTSITYEGTVDTTKVGEYPITYKVKDLDNQETTKTITVTVEEKQFIPKSGKFYLEELSYNNDDKKVTFTGYLAIKGVSNSPTDNIAYDVIFENQLDGSSITMPLSRLTSGMPFNIPGESGLDYSGSWFKEKLDLTSIPSGDYTIYVRARNNDYEAKELVNNIYFCDKVASKFSIDGKGFRFKVNYIKRAFPIELFVRDGGLITNVNNPTIDNMYNQVNQIKLNGSNLDILAVSHNVGGNYAGNQEVERYVMLENIRTFELSEPQNVGSITNGPYMISLRVSDGFNKTKVWYKTTLDLSNLETGTYTIQTRTKTGDIDDYGELYDVMYKDDLNTSQTVVIGDKTITIRRNEEKRFRIEIVVE